MSTTRADSPKPRRPISSSLLVPPEADGEDPRDGDPPRVGITSALSVIAVYRCGSTEPRRRARLWILRAIEQTCMIPNVVKVVRNFEVVSRIERPRAFRSRKVAARENGSGVSEIGQGSANVRLSLLLDRFSRCRKCNMPRGSEL